MDFSGSKQVEACPIDRKPVALKAGVRELARPSKPRR